MITEQERKYRRKYQKKWDYRRRVEKRKFNFETELHYLRLQLIEEVKKATEETVGYSSTLRNLSKVDAQSKRIKHIQDLIKLIKSLEELMVIVRKLTEADIEGKNEHGEQEADDDNVSMIEKYRMKVAKETEKLEKGLDKAGIDFEGNLKGVDA